MKTILIILLLSTNAWALADWKENNVWAKRIRPYFGENNGKLDMNFMPPAPTMWEKGKIQVWDGERWYLFNEEEISKEDLEYYYQVEEMIEENKKSTKAYFSQLGRRFYFFDGISSIWGWYAYMPEMAGWGTVREKIINHPEFSKEERDLAFKDDG